MISPALPLSLFALLYVGIPAWKHFAAGGGRSVAGSPDSLAPARSNPFLSAPVPDSPIASTESGEAQWGNTKRHALGGLDSLQRTIAAERNPFLQRRGV